MDERAQKILDEILAKDPSALTEEDKQILRARWHYVGRNSRSKFAEVLQEQPHEQAAPDKVQQGTIKEEKKTDPSQHPADQDDDGEDEEDTLNGDSSTQDEE